MPNLSKNGFQKSLPTSLFQREENTAEGSIPPLKKGDEGGFGISFGICLPARSRFGEGRDFDI
jgi:hypothetical protein